MQAIGFESEISKNMNFYPLIPYAQGYVRRANEMGVIGMLNEALEPASTSTKFKILLKGGINVMRKDFLNILSTLIDVELLPFNGYSIKAVFLHNIITDLALALKAQNIFEFYIDYIKDNYRVTPAFGTMNFAALTSNFNDWGLDNQLIMASFNKKGFQMNPSKEECEKCLRIYKVNVLAMSTLASGYLTPDDAFEYLYSLPNVNSIVIGMSSRDHVKNTFESIKKAKK
jgi:hypothetical protein